MNRPEFFQIEFRRFFEVGDGFLDRVSLADRSHFGTLCYVQVILSVKNCGKGSQNHINTSCG
jgi:hypothetical protein